LLPSQNQKYNLYKADYNVVLKIKWGEAMRQAEKKKALKPAQFGCRKRKTAHDPMFIKTMQNEITRFTRQQYSQINFDAQAFFD
jgi:hypothetical protein